MNLFAPGKQPLANASNGSKAPVRRGLNVALEIAATQPGGDGRRSSRSVLDKCMLWGRRSKNVAAEPASDRCHDLPQTTCICWDTVLTRRSVSGGCPENSHRTLTGFLIGSVFNPVIARWTSAADHTGFSI